MLGLLLSAAALTASFAEAPQLALGTRFCADATGAPGQVAVEASTGVRFLEATREGFRARDAVDLGPTVGCPVTSVRANGAGVIAAGARTEDFTQAVVAVVRDPGGSWSAPVALTSSEDWYADDVEAAVADSGDAVVSWIEHRPDDDLRRFRVARRAPGGAFGPAETVGAFGKEQRAVWADVAASGETVVMTATEEASRRGPRVPVRVGVAPRGGAFPALTQLGTVQWRSLPALAVAPDGRALATLHDGTSVLVAERAPGEAFGPAVPVAQVTDVSAVRTDVAVGAGGAAAVAWTGEEEGATGITTRTGTGTFTPHVAIRPRVAFTGDPFWVSPLVYWNLALGSPFWGRYSESLALMGDGQAALTHFEDGDVHGVYQQRVGLTTIPLGGDRAETRIFGGVVGLSMAPDPIVLGDGATALLWVERIDETQTLHLAAAGATAPPEEPTPQVHVGSPASPVVARGEQLVLPISCSGPCDVRAQAVGGSRATGRFRSKRAARGRLKLDTGSVPLAPKRLGPVRIRLTYGTYNTQYPKVRMLTVRLVRPPDPPAPRLVGLRAERSGNAILVTWQVRRPLSTQAYFLTGTATREWSGDPLAFKLTYSTKRRRSFSVTLSPAEGTRWVTLRSTAARDVRLVVRVNGPT